MISLASCRLHSQPEKTSSLLVECDFLHFSYLYHLSLLHMWIYIWQLSSC